MLHENIRACRKERNLSQEELAAQLHVVRQTLSKWEQGLSVPDANALVQLAAVLEVPVSRLLGTACNEKERAALAEELARCNAALAESARRAALVEEAGRKRGWILLLSFLAMAAALAIDNGVVSLLLAGGFLLVAVVILYRNLALLTSLTTADLRLGVLRLTTLFNLALLVLVLLAALLTGTGLLTVSEAGEKTVATALIAAVMVFSGVMGPRLPYNRHTGLRLPWTVRDEDTWNVAHRVLGYISAPLALLYVGCAWTVADFEAVTLGAVLLWVGIPGVISGVFYWRKWRR